MDEPFSRDEFGKVLQWNIGPDMDLRRLVATAAALFRERDRCSAIARSVRDSCAAAGRPHGVAAAEDIERRILSPAEDPVEMRPVSSSNIASVGYKDRVLYVRFHSGQTWRYHDVPAETFASFVASKSLGRYLSKAIIPFYKSEAVASPGSS